MATRLQRLEQLLREGEEFRERGDTTNALARFQEALDSEPDNTGVLEEMAQTYESMQLFDRANDVWRRIKQIIPSDSATYALAALSTPSRVTKLLAQFVPIITRKKRLQSNQALIDSSALLFDNRHFYGTIL